MGVASLEEEILKNYHRDEIKIGLPQIESGHNHKAERNIELLTNNISNDLLSVF